MANKNYTENIYKLINWGELSRLLAGSRCVITKKRIGKKHEKAIKNLLGSIQKWYDAKNNA